MNTSMKNFLLVVKSDPTTVCKLHMEGLYLCSTGCCLRIDKCRVRFSVTLQYRIKFTVTFFNSGFPHSLYRLPCFIS